MLNALFVESSNGTGKSSPMTLSGHVWNWLQQLKQEVTQELIDEGPLCRTDPDDLLEERVLAADGHELELRHRSQLEARLRDITDAQDRLLDGEYGKCLECGEQISLGRLAADPVASMCLKCQKAREIKTVFPTL